MPLIPSPPVDSSPRSRAARWTVQTYDTLVSTNPHARTLPAWHAVRAATQTGGYGRTGRHWVSDRGGLWLSAVLPTPGPASFWSILPLAAGWAVIEVLSGLGIQNLHLRWPNDIMLGRRKLAGLLLERFSPDTAVVGLGINVTNQPAREDASLLGSTVNLAELLPTAPELDALAAAILSALADMQDKLLTEGFAPIAETLNTRHLRARRVEITLNGHPRPLCARFHGIDDTGRLRVATEDGVSRLFAAHDIALLRELD